MKAEVWIKVHDYSGENPKTLNQDVPESDHLDKFRVNLQKTQHCKFKSANALGLDRMLANEH